MLPPKWVTLVLIVMAALAVGGGAAVGTVMQGDLQANIPLTVSQALGVGKPEPHDFPAGRKFFSSISSDQTNFSVALEMYRGEALSVLVPVINHSSGDAVAQLSVTMPDVPSLMVGVPGVDLSVMGSGEVTDVVKVSPNTWAFTAKANMASSTDGLLLTFKVSPTAMAGFFNIKGQIRTSNF